MQAGFIGTGSMGSLLIDSFILSGVLEPEEIAASNRTFAKTARLADRYPGLRAAPTNADAAKNRDIIFLCVKPGDYITVLDEIKEELDARQILVSITSPVLIRHLEGVVPCKVAKIIPSVTNYALTGASLCMYGSRLEAEDRLLLDRLMAGISTPVHLPEAYTRISSDLSSCGPAFFAFLLRKYIEAAVSVTGIPPEDANRLAVEMLYGTGKLLTTGGFTPEQLELRVAVPGGITAAGLNLMEQKLDDLFVQLIGVTHAKYEKDVEKAEAAFHTMSDRSD